MMPQVTTLPDTQPWCSDQFDTLHWVPVSCWGFRQEETFVWCPSCGGPSGSRSASGWGSQPCVVGMLRAAGALLTPATWCLSSPGPGSGCHGHTGSSTGVTSQLVSPFFVRLHLGSQKADLFWHEILGNKESQNH